ncbi:MAG TPA: complex I NDUFA9 subunit family protein [Rhodobiaceae bacterium]|nr:complex I NDUFA9 subunit family protein [Rhodobiaceae bacterium]
MAGTQTGPVVVFGGSGFVGRHIVRRLAKDGFNLRVVVRRPNEALFLKTAGRTGQIDLMQGNIRDSASTRAALAGASGVINAVGILYETGPQKFDAVQNAGAANLATLAAEHGIDQFVQISAIGADATSASAYARSKAEGENAVLAACPQAHILRPSIVVGPEDDFFNRFATMAQLAPALPLIGGGLTRYQPVGVFDVAQAVAACLAGAPSGIYELGGPQIYSFRELMELMLEKIGKTRLLVPLPFAAAKMLSQVTRFLPNPPLTPDQVILLRSDNIVGQNIGDLAALGVEPTPIAALLDSYLGRYRGASKTV